ALRRAAGRAIAVAVFDRTMLIGITLRARRAGLGALAFALHRGFRRTAAASSGDGRAAQLATVAEGPLTRAAADHRAHGLEDLRPRELLTGARTLQDLHGRIRELRSPCLRLAGRAEVLGVETSLCAGRAERHDGTHRGRALNDFPAAAAVWLAQA